eukprot:sb/3473849/
MVNREPLTKTPNSTSRFNQPTNQPDRAGFEEVDTTSYTCSLYQYTNPKNLEETWKLVKPRSQLCSQLLRTGHSAVYYEGSLVVLGGYGPLPNVHFITKSDVMVYNIEQKIWSQLDFKDTFPFVALHSATTIGRADRNNNQLELVI